MLTIGVAVPCYGPHVSSLPALLESVANQTFPPAHVVVSSSDTPEAPSELLNRRWPFKLDILVRAERRNAAQNRNAAARALHTDLISFIDADDTMHPQRLEIITHVVGATGVDVVLHGCLSPPSPDYARDYPPLTAPWPHTVNAAGDKRPRFETRYQPVHGHVTISRALGHKYSQPENLSFERREDSEFVDRLIMMRGVRSAFIDLPLTKYMSAGVWQGAPPGSGEYALGATASIARAVMGLGLIKAAKPTVQALWRQLPLPIRQRFLK